jgi:hypothetical protein
MCACCNFRSTCHLMLFTGSLACRTVCCVGTSGKLFPTERKTRQRINHVHISPESQGFFDVSAADGAVARCVGNRKPSSEIGGRQNFAKIFLPSPKKRSLSCTSIFTNHETGTIWLILAVKTVTNVVTTRSMSFLLGGGKHRLFFVQFDESNDWVGFCPLTCTPQVRIIEELLPRFANLFRNSMVCMHRVICRMVDAPMVWFLGAVSTRMVQ